MIIRTSWRLLLRGILLGIVAALLGSLAFTILVFLILASREGGFSGVLTWEGIAAVLGYALIPGLAITFGLSLVPAALGGMALAGLIRYMATRVTQIVLVSTLIGIILGATAAGLSALIGLRTVLWDLAAMPELYVPLLFLACSIAAIAGGLVGRSLSLPYRG
jgi:hypothetical protein